MELSHSYILCNLGFLNFRFLACASDQDHVLSFSIADIRAIPLIRHYDDDNVDLLEEAISSETIKLFILIVEIT